ncbi:hypothetical protein GCM10027445_10620 [Amycolatopsis endophytica]|uniref:PPM-type phosphatase domain-containing protein n=1 Tax=Amycolatopsis endophytica TaxID=860233 RepID=A0A853AXJ2_9PSEU|nr:SpoIIE family protein phosphatase [Amycolatopsis endophytica]NYI87296.1 hypothetical protein [Amycolatopsis endophytica]
MREWYRERDLLGLDGEQLVPPTFSLQDTVGHILADVFDEQHQRALPFRSSWRRRRGLTARYDFGMQALARVGWKPQRLTLAAELQWQLLPGRSCSRPEYRIDALLQQAYATLLLRFELDTGRVEVVDAGSPQLWLLREEGVEPVKFERQLPLGMFENTRTTASTSSSDPVTG